MDAQDLQAAQPQFFYVGGEVATPGRFLWTNGTTLAAALELAHGYTEFANRSVAQIKDATGSSVTVNYAAPLDPKETTTLIRGRNSGYAFFPGQTFDKKDTTTLIQPGATVFVPRIESRDEKQQ